MKRSGKLVLLLLLIAAAVAFWAFDLGSVLTLSALKARQAELSALVASRPLVAVGGFFILYVTAAALSVPGAVVLTVAAGAIFGLWLGTLVVSFASAIGATLAFLSSRFLLRDWVEARFAKRVAAIDAGIARDGASYLLTLRLIPVFPFFLVNLAMGLTAMRARTFYWVSQLGMLPATAVFVNAGTQLASLRGTGDILSARLLGALLLLGVFPLLVKAVVGWLARRKLYAGHTRPRRFDRNLIVIGAGAGGLVTSYIAAVVRAKVTLVEAHEMGGDCLNRGCVPSKALIRSAQLAHEMRNAEDYGLTPADPRVDLARVMRRVRQVIADIAPADSPERYRALGVDVQQGRGRIVDPWTVEITASDGTAERLTSRAIVIAAGGEPFVPPIPGLAEAGPLTSDTIWDAIDGRPHVPARMVILGGGPIGTEFAQAFARLGSKVTQVEKGPRILPREEPEASALVAEVLREEGVDVRTETEAVRCEDKTLIVRSAMGEEAIPFDEIVVAVGRRPKLTGYGLEELGVVGNGKLAVDEKLRTHFPHILAAGDVAGGYQFTHFAAHQAWHAAVNGLFAPFRTFAVDQRFVPWTTFTDPEVAHVGLTEETARAEGTAYEIVRYDLGHLDRAVAEGARRGFVKLLVVPGKDRILGATVVAANAGEVLPELVLAMKQGLGLGKILGTIHAYPTMAEANKYAAGEWRKAHQPERVLRLLARFHAWRRG